VLLKLSRRSISCDSSVREYRQWTGAFLALVPIPISHGDRSSDLDAEGSVDQRSQEGGRKTQRGTSYLTPSNSECLGHFLASRSQLPRIRGVESLDYTEELLLNVSVVQWIRPYTALNPSLHWALSSRAAARLDDILHQCAAPVPSMANFCGDQSSCISYVCGTVSMIRTGCDCAENEAIRSTYDTVITRAICGNLTEFSPLPL
jgi:hypothetical protein